MKGKSIFTLQFADDQVIIAKSKNDLEKIAVKIKGKFERRGIHMNVSKTKYLCIGGNETEQNLNNTVLSKSLDTGDF